MRPLTKLLAVAVLSGTALVGSASAQFIPPPRPSLPIGVRPVPVTPPSYVPVTPGILPGGCVVPPPRPLPPPVIDIDYKVMYRTGPWGHWHYYATAETRHEARRLERHLETQGYQVNVVEKFDGYRR
jgi:hypothetical protein